MFCRWTNNPSETQNIIEWRALSQRVMIVCKKCRIHIDFYFFFASKLYLKFKWIYTYRLMNSAYKVYPKLSLYLLFKFENKCYYDGIAFHPAGGLWTKWKYVIMLVMYTWTKKNIYSITIRVRHWEFHLIEKHHYHYVKRKLWWRCIITKNFFFWKIIITIFNRQEYGSNSLLLVVKT